MSNASARYQVLQLFASDTGHGRQPHWTNMNRPGFMMDAKRFTKTALDGHGMISIRIHQATDANNTWIGVVDDSRGPVDDNLGALYYVVAVIFIYGLSIVMMIASHIRKNKEDNQLRTYLKEMAKLRKDDRRYKVLNKMTDIAKRRQQESKNKLQSLDSDAESEGGRNTPLRKDTSGETTDSVFLSPDYCKTPDSISPSLSDSRYNFEPDRVRSPSFHDYRRWKRSHGRSVSVQDYKSTVRVQKRPSLSLYDHRSVFTYADSQTSSQNELRLSPLCVQDSCSTVQEPHPFRWYKPKLLSGSNAKIHKISYSKQAQKVDQLRLNLPANFHLVDEDAVL